MIYFHFFITFIELFNEIDLKEENKTTGSSTMSPAVEFAVNYHQWILLKFMPFIHGNILEIGTGKGYYKKSIHTSGYFVSIDNEENIIKHTKELDPDGLYYFADISDKSTLNVIKQSSFQTILCFNVLEHIEEDEKALGNMLYLLEENGYLIIFVPAFRTLYSSKDKLAGHLRRYIKKSLKMKLKKFNNADIIKLEYFNPIGGVGSLVNKFINHRSLNNKSIRFQTKFFDKYLVSLSKAINPCTKNIFGQSLICVIQKKAMK